MFVERLPTPVPNWCQQTLSTPLLRSSLHYLSAGPTAAQKFPDLLDIIDQDTPLTPTFSAYGCEQKSPVSTPKTDSELVDLVLSMSDTASREDDIQMPPGTYTYIRAEDKRRSLRKGRKGQHAKKMAELDEYMKQQRKENKEQEKEKIRQRFLKPTPGMRKSSRTKEKVKYFE